MRAVYKNELKRLGCTFTGYLFIAVFLLTFGGFTVIYNLIGGQGGYESVISLATLPQLILIPILTMRSFAEERRQKSDRLLYSLPLDMAQIVLGKFLALVTWISIPFAIVCLYPLLLSAYGEMHLLAAYGALLGFFVLLCVLITIGMFVSALTENQMIACALSFIALLALYLLPLFSAGISTSGLASLALFSLLFLGVAAAAFALCRNLWVALAVFILPELPLLILYFKDMRLLSGVFAAFLDAVSIFNYFGVFTGGIFDWSAIILFLSVAALFLFFTAQAMEQRRWN